MGACMFKGSISILLSVYETLFPLCSHVVCSFQYAGSSFCDSGFCFETARVHGILNVFASCSLPCAPVFYSLLQFVEILAWQTCPVCSIAYSGFGLCLTNVRWTLFCQRLWVVSRFALIDQLCHFFFLANYPQNCIQFRGACRC